MKPTDHTHGPNDETPNQKRERESRERLNKQYAEHHGFPVPGSEDVVDDLEDNVTEQGGDTNESHFPRRVDLGLTRDDIHQRASDILRNNDAGSNSDESDSGIIWLPSDSDSDIPAALPVVYPNTRPEFDYTASSSAGGNGGGGRDGNDDDGWTMDDSDDDDEINDDENFYSADNPDDTDNVDTIPFDDEASADSDEFEDSEDSEDDDNLEDDEHDEENENDEGDEDDDDDDDDTPGMWTRVTSFLRGNPDRRWGDSLPKWMKQAPMANGAGILTALPTAKVVGNVLLNGVAAGAPLATYIGLPLASSGSLLVSAARTSRGRDNARRRQEEEPISPEDLEEIRRTLSLNEGEDLIDTAEEQTAAQVVDRLGILKVKTFPLCGSDEEYAQEVYRRIHPVLSRGAHHDGHEEPEIEHEGVPGGCPERWSEKKKEKIRKQLRSQKLYDAYVQLLADAHHDAEHAHDEGGHDHGHSKPLKALTESQIKQVSVQLGRMMYNRHLVQNHFGRAFGLAGAAVLGTMTGTIVPMAIAGGIEGGRELYRRYRVNKSHLRYDFKGNIVNTKDGKDILVLPPEKKIEEDHEDHRTHEEKAHDLAEAKKKKESASEKCDKLKNDIKELEVKIETDKETRDELERKIENILRDAETRTLTMEDKRQIDKYEMERDKIDLAGLQQQKNALIEQRENLIGKIQRAQTAIQEQEKIIGQLETKIGDTSSQEAAIQAKRDIMNDLKLEALLDQKDTLEQRQKRLSGKIALAEEQEGKLKKAIDKLEEEIGTKMPSEEQRLQLEAKKAELTKLDVEGLRAESDTLELEHKRIIRKIEQAQATINDCKKFIQDIEKKLQEGFYDAALQRQIQEKRTMIDRIGLPGLTQELAKVGRLEQDLTAKIQTQTERHAGFQRKIDEIYEDATDKKPNKKEQQEIDAAKAAIAKLNIRLSENKLKRFNADLLVAEENKKTTAKEYTKELEASRKHHEEKEDGFWKKSTKFIFASNPVQTALNFTKDVAIHGTAGAVGGAVIGSFIGVPGWGATLVGGWVAGKYLVNRLTGAANNPHPKVDVHHDTAHGKKDDHGHAKKDDHKTDTHH